ncbi:MAG: 50S ribosomal protein L18 [Bacteroidia bacterium]|nr:50S ribosomal protein L18 [Bacteroidia bacterium]
MSNQKELRRVRIKQGIRKRMLGTVERPRLSVFRSNNHIYAQIIDDTTGKTLVSSSSNTKSLLEHTGTKTEISMQVGKALAERASASGITKIVFDRNGFKYHGRIKALAEGAREGGLLF